MKLLRRLIAAMTATVLAAVAVRLGGASATPAQHGGWQPLELPE